MKKRVISFVCMIVILVFCAGTVFAEEQTVDFSKGATYTTTVDDITVTITTDKAEYEAEETINYTITIENGRKNWDIKSGKITYGNTAGLNSLVEMPGTISKIACGESFVIEGSVVGDVEVFGTAPTGPDVKMIALIVAAVVAVVIVVAVIVFIIIKKKKGTKLACLVLALILCMELVPVNVKAATQADGQTVIRPYLNVKYAGQDVTIRAMIYLEMQQQLLAIAPEDRLVYQKVSCHDPSIFKDFDGKYYVFGTHITASTSDNLYNWKNIDSTFKAALSEDTRAKIKAWNDDDSAGAEGYLWAPDIIYNESMKKYCIYLSANGDTWKSNIVLLTSDKVTGPYDYAGSIVYGGFTADTFGQTDAPQVLGTTEIPERYVTHGIKNKRWGDKWPNCIDPCVFFDDNGKLWMAYGSWSGGIFILELDENTGLRDYSVSYETNDHSDAYFGKKIAGGAYVSGEGSYIEKIGDYYYLFMSYGNLEAKGGYNVRIFRSKTPDGNYVDMLGNSAIFDRYVFNYNLSVGVRLMGGYKWRNFNTGFVAQGHNSAFVDDDGKAYMVFHARTNAGNEGHTVKVHQLFNTKEGWLVAAPYQTTGETMKPDGYSVADVAGEYEVIIHELAIEYGNLEVKTPKLITLTEDGKITGELEGTWALEAGTPYITLSFDGRNYSGVTLKMNIEYTKIETMVFTAVGLENQVTIWGSKSIN